MKLLKDRVHIRETGFVPGAVEAIGLESTWSFSEKLREHQDKRIGVVTHIGMMCNEVEVGMTVVYNAKHTVPIEIDGEKLLRIREDEIYGILEQTKN